MLNEWDALLFHQVVAFANTLQDLIGNLWWKYDLAIDL